MNLFKILLTQLLVLTSCSCFTQINPDQYLAKVPLNGKPALDFKAIENWTGLTDDVSICDDGKYFSYRSYSAGRNYITVQSTENSWAKVFPDAQPGVFSSDGNWYAFQKKDSLLLLSLVDKGEPKFTGLITGYKTNDQKNKNAVVNWIAYQLQESDKAVILHHFTTGKETRIEGATSFDFEESGRWMICKLANGGLLLQPLGGQAPQRFEHISRYVLDKTGQRLALISKKGETEQLEVVELSSGKRQMIWEGQGIGTVVMDAVGKQMAFIVTDKKASANSIWYWATGKDKAEERLNNNSSQIDKGLFIGNTLSFVASDAYLSFVLEPAKDTRKPIPNAAQVDIWHYRDTQIQSGQLAYPALFNNNILWLEPQRYRSVVNIHTGNVIQLGDSNIEGYIRGNYGMQRRDDSRRDPFTSDAKDSVWIVSQADGKRHFLGLQYIGDAAQLSVSGRYLVWFDKDTGHYFTYEIATGRQVNVSAKVPVTLATEMNVDPGNWGIQRTGILGWLAGDEGLLVYDNYDIWQLDPAGRKAPVNVTNGYGRRHGVRLRLTKGECNKDYSKEPISPHDMLLLTAADTANYSNGFFHKSLKQAGDPEKLVMGPFVLDWTPIGMAHQNGGVPAHSMAPLKARNSEVWIVRRQSANDAPNYFVTRDLKTYKRLTDIQPQQDYNWITKELVSFRQMDGTTSRGLLYKPENFDPSKKYPLIILNYFQYTHKLHEFPELEYANNAEVNIPWLVNRGYLVFTPDTRFIPNRPRPASAWNTVEGAARYLKTLSYIDASRMGVTGHSRGGGYTNYIITHSTQFAAAFEGAGVIDWVSSQLTIILGSGVVRQPSEETDLRNGKMAMMDNPILHSDKITSPLLIFHNKEDRAVPWEQAVELYIAMRRLGKKVWMLQYDKESHSLTLKKNKIDLTIRMTQFFDHYLKGAPAPIWMTRGVRASLKGIETGYEFDMSGRKP